MYWKDIKSIMVINKPVKRNVTRNNSQNDINIYSNVLNIFLYYTCLMPNVTTACHYTARGHPTVIVIQERIHTNVKMQKMSVRIQDF